MSLHQASILYTDRRGSGWIVSALDQRRAHSELTANLTACIVKSGASQVLDAECVVVCPALQAVEFHVNVKMPCEHRVLSDTGQDEN